MLPEEEFKTKYNTIHKQIREESYIEEVSEEDRLVYSDVEILTGKTGNRINKFFSAKGHNKDKKYNTTRLRMQALWKKFLDNTTEEEVNEVFTTILNSAKKDYNYAKLLTDRMLGKEEENVNLNVEGDISFTIDIDENSKKRKEKNLGAIGEDI